MAVQRKVGAWGFEGVDYPAPPPLLALLSERIGPAKALPRFDPARFKPPPPRRLPDLRCEPSREDFDRLAHSRGQSLTDLLRLRGGRVPAVADAVLRPASEAEVEQALQACAANEVRVIPFGGGTSVTGGVNVVPGDEPVVSLDLGRLSGLLELDETSGLATLRAGTRGPDVETALARRGFTLGHFPQSFELSTVGGWIATRASGQESLGYGGMERLLAGFELVAPAGRLELAAFPASAVGPDLRQLVLGSEGRLGVITRATLRVRPRRPALTLRGALLPSWEAGVEGAREILKSRIPLDLLRLSDETETEAALALGLSRERPLGRILRRVLSLRGMSERSCLMLYGASGPELEAGRTLDAATDVLRPRGFVPLGASAGRRWMADRFRLPYLRDALLDHGYATDTLETAAPWSRLANLRTAVGDRIEKAVEAEDERIVSLCHLSHAYLDGASLYFTLFFRCPNDPDQASARWARLKRAATEAVVDGGGTLSHHHGVGMWHAPWYAREVGGFGRRLVAAAAEVLDPKGVLNPHVLLDPADRLEI